jgi:type IV secretion system protein VirD4
MRWFEQSEREKWASPAALARPRVYRGLPTFDARSRDLYERALPRGVLVPRFTPDRPPINYWMPPHELAEYAYRPGQIILGKFANTYLGYLDDRPQVTIAGARAGKTSTVLEPNLYLYPSSMLVLDPKGDLSTTAAVRHALGHNVYVLDPFGQTGMESACFNVLAELDPDSWTIVDDVASVAQALIINDGDARAKHWTDSARDLTSGLTMTTLRLPPEERNLITVRQLLCLNHPRLINAVKVRATGASKDEKFFNENSHAVEILLRAMANAGNRFGGILAGIGNRFLNMAVSERSSVFSTAAAQTNFLDSLPLRAISQWSDFGLAQLRADRPTTIYLCLPVGRMESHSRWLRLIVQMACTVLEQMGTYPRHRPPILFMMEEFATLGRMEIMERAAAYFPGFGVKLWAVLQDITQLQYYYQSGWETFLGNAGLVQCFANGDQSTLNYIAQRLERLIMPFELRTAFSRRQSSQLLMIEGERPAAAMRLDHVEVDAIHRMVLRPTNQ